MKLLLLILLAAQEPAAPDPAQAKAFAMFVPQRDDDFAWENDRIAYRVYGPALEKKDGPQSGIDVWVKSVRRPILEKWYAGKDYHRDRGEGLDYYKVGSSRGCGGLGVWDGRDLHASRNFAAWKILENGPERVRFQLTYKSWTAGDRRVSEVRTVSLACGANLNRFEAVFESPSAEPLTIAVGVARRPGATLKQDRSLGLLASWEPATANGSTGCGVLVDPARIVGFAETKTDHLVLVRATPGEPLLYRAGAGWSKSGDFADADGWFRHLEAEARHGVK